MTNLSATIITLNEEKNLKRCLESLKYFVDEIVVLDSGSGDKTLEIAKEAKAKVFERKFDNFASQKNSAAGHASGDWILSVDADEVIPKSLADEIVETIKSEDFDAYLIPRRNFILGAEIKHSRWSPDKHIWLWKKEKGSWVGDVHEEVKVNGKVGELKHAKLHHQEETVMDFIKQNNRYSTIQAKYLHKNGEKFSIVKLFWNPIFEFGIRFVYKSGFLDGWRGLVLAVLMSYYHLQVQWKLLGLQKNTHSG